MSDGGDYDAEMFRRNDLDDETIERLLTGHHDATVPETLVSFVEDTRLAASTRGPTPSPMLSSLFADGLSTETGDLPATAASNVTGPAPQAAGLPKWRTNNVIDITRARLAKVGLAAKIGVAAGALTLTGTAAAATGSLPDVAQSRVAAAVERVGITIPGGKSAEHRQDDEHRQDGERGAGEVEATDAGETPESAEFGESVSDRATSGAAQEDGQQFGDDVSSEAVETHQPTEPPTADDNPGTDAAEQAPAGQPETTPTAEGNPGTEAAEQAPAGQPADAPTAEENPGSHRPRNRPS